MDDPFELYLDRLNVQDILYYGGYRQNKRDGLRYPSFVRLDSDGRRIHGDKFICMPGGKTCFKPPTIKSYNIISLITSFPELYPESRNYKGADLVHAVCRSILNMPAEKRNTEVMQPLSQKPFDIKDYKAQPFYRYEADSYRQFMPYMRERGISISTLQAFGRHVMVTQKKAEEGKKSYRYLSFPFRIPGEKNIVGLEERGRSRLDGASGYKGMAQGTNASEGLWIASPKSTDLKAAKHVYWFESGYDAMAYYQLHAPRDNALGKAVFLSTGGNPSVMQFRGVIQQATDACHHLCFDNDLAGKQYVMNFKNELRRMREAMPKIPEDMKPYMATISDESYLKGAPELLPDELRKAYDRYFDESDELQSMQSSGLSVPEDVEEQENKVRQLYQEWRQMMGYKLCIGQEQGPLKDLGTYDVPEWALYAMENGDYEGLTEEETHILNDFMGKHFPEGFVSTIDWDNPNEFNVQPSFGTRNPNALTQYGESPYLAVKTYPVRFFHPSQREGEALPNLTVQTETPGRGAKDFNDELKIQNEEARKREAIDARSDEEDDKTLTTGLDLDSDGEVETMECDVRKQKHTMGR